MINSILILFIQFRYYAATYISILSLVLSSFILTNCGEQVVMPNAEKKQYITKIHGVELQDDYHWLRDTNWPNVQDKDILKYLEDENKYAENFFKDKEALKSELFEEIKSKIKLTDQTLWTKKDNYFYYTRTEEDKNYPIYCRKKGSMQADEEILIDVNELSKDANYFSLSSFSVSPDHKLLAYSFDDTGGEKYKIKILNLKNREYLSDEITNTLGKITWHEDQKGFFYTPVNDKWRVKEVKYHKLGDDPSKDKQIFFEEDDLQRVKIYKSSSKEYFFISSEGHDSSEIYYFKMQDDSYVPKKLLSRKDKVFYNVDHGTKGIYVHTNDSGQNFRLAIIEGSEFSEENMKDLLPHDNTRYLEAFDITKNYLIANYKNLALAEIEIFDVALKKEKVTFPDEVYVASGYSTNYEEDDIRINYSSLRMPDSIYFYNYEKNKLILGKQRELSYAYNPEDYVVKREWAEAKDGVRVPMSILYKKSEFKPDGDNPLYLYGYGSYGISVSPNFKASALTLADRGFVYAIAHIRGGDDLGFSWYESAKFLNKKRTFEDFLSSAEHLVQKKYSKRGKITISGGSAGGMLVGYCVNKDPGMFKAVIAHVPFVDVLNTMLDDTLPLTPGEFKEWGNPKDKEYFDYIRSYSPYDNIKNQAYPNIFITAGLSDPRVTYWEPAKFTAKLREYNTSDNIILLKTNMSAGHSGASKRFEYLEEMAEEFAFIISVY
jgi:oligopeptidase B